MASREERRKELMKQKRNILKKKCKSLKISGEGSKMDMVHRIIVKMCGVDISQNNMENSNAQYRIIPIPPSRNERKSLQSSKASKKTKKPQKAVKIKRKKALSKPKVIPNKSMNMNINHRDILLIEGYNRNHCKLNIDQRIHDIIRLFAFSFYKNITFSSKYKSKNGLKLLSKNKLAIKRDNNEESWVLCDVKPIYKGSVCWRVFIHNPNKGLLGFGVSSKKGGKTLSHNKVYANYYKIQKECIIDILLNATKGTIKVCKVGLSDKDETQIKDLPINDKCTKGWIPYVYFSKKTKNTKINIKEIDKYWYAKMDINPLLYITNYYDELSIRKHKNMRITYFNNLKTDKLTYHDRKLLIDGFCRTHCNKISLNLNKMYHYIYSFSFFLSKRLKFSEKYKSFNALELINGNQTVIKLSESYSWILADIEPVFSGIHCWRVYVYNPDLEYLKFGVSSLRMFNDIDYDEDNVWGIARARDSDYYKPKHHKQRNNINLQHFIQEKYAVDILLNANKGTLHLSVVGMEINDRNEAKLWGINTNNECKGFVPHFLFGWESTKTTMDIYQIDPMYYAKKGVLSPITMYDNGLTFHFVGIRNIHKNSDRFPFGDIDMSSLNYYSYKSSLNVSDTIHKLKELIKTLYEIPQYINLLILYSNHIISYDDTLTLHDFGITNDSVLLICIKAEIDSIKASGNNIKREDILLNDYNLTNAKTTKGFDIICQEFNELYVMPNCGHLMNKESLYQYALIQYRNINNIYLKCPHEKKEDIINEWSCVRCTYLNDINRTICEMCNHRKPIINKSKYCDRIWHYMFIKQILLKIKSNNINLLILELLSSRNKLQNEYNIQKCPKCLTIYYKDNNEYKTQCILCSSSNKYFFCWGCGDHYYDDNHFCDITFAMDLVKILQNCATKKIGSVYGVPLIRCCPCCGQLITHTEACKHMKCKQCRKSFCFVCLKVYKDGIGWQCGSPSTTCPIAPRQNIDEFLDNIMMKKKAVKLF